jgi:hypothetical protein
MMKRQQARKQRRAQAVQPAAQTINLPLPLSGLFQEARAAKVSNLFAAELTNWRSTGLKMVLRPGIAWQGSPAPVIQRIPFEFGGNPRYIELRASQASCGAVTHTRMFAGNASWGEISSNVIIADGYGDPVRFNGTAFTTCSFSTVTGADPAKFDGMIVHHDRIYFWKTNGALEFYYGDVGAVTGGLARFPLDRLGNIRGSIAAMVSLTVDAGHGMNDMLCIVTTTGQLVLYEGLNPGDSSDWRLTGRVQAARPVSRNAFVEVGSDAWMLTPLGVVSIGESIRNSVLALSSDISAPIGQEIEDLVATGTGTWKMFLAGDGSMIVISRAVGLTAKQFIYYTKSKSWAAADMPVRDWHNLSGMPQCTGFDGRIGTLKHKDSGEAITARWVSSWFETGREVSVTFLQPVIRAEGPLTVRVVVLSDNNDTATDIAESEQTVTLEPEEDDGGVVTLLDQIGCDAVGSTFQITIEVTATWAEIISLKAGIA